MLMASLQTIAPELVLALGAMVLLMIGVFRGDRSLPLLSGLAVALYLFAGLTLLHAAPTPTLAFDGLYIADGFSSYLKVLIFAAAAVATALAPPYLARTHSARFEYPVLLMLAVTGMAMMVSANNLLSLYVGLELQSLAAYVLASFHRNDTHSSEAGLKYFVLGALASGILLYGTSLVYGFAGTTSFTDLATILHAPTRGLGVLIGLVFILSGLAFKISAVPFHMWTPDVYEGAPTPVAAFFASAPKAAALGLLVRVAVQAFGGLTNDWQQIVIFTAIASMLLGAVGAIGQTNIKRLLAYSSIANIGFALIGLATGTAQGVAALLFYLAVYLAMTLGSFLCLMQLRSADGEPIETLDGLAGLSRRRPGLAAAFAIFMFSLAGIPPLLGFMPKFAVFNAAIAAHLYALAILGVLASVIGAYYYLRVIKMMYFDAPSGELAAADNRINGAMIAVAAVFCSPLGMLAMTPMVAAATHAAQALF